MAEETTPQATLEDVSGNHAKGIPGSFSFDPRPKTSNTEMGLLIDSKDMVNRMQAAFGRNLDTLVQEVTSDEGNLKLCDGGAKQTDDLSAGLFKGTTLTVIGVLSEEWFQ